MEQDVFQHAHVVLHLQIVIRLMEFVLVNLVTPVLIVGQLVHQALGVLDVSTNAYVQQTAYNVMYQLELVLVNLVSLDHCVNKNVRLVHGVKTVFLNVNAKVVEYVTL